MASFTPTNDFYGHMPNGVHDLSSNTLKLALSNTAPSAETSDPTADGNGVLANVTEIAYTNLVSQTQTVSSSSQTGGTYKLILDDFNMEASGGSVGPFRYIYLYDDTATNDEILGYYDYGSELTLADGEKLNMDYSETDGVLQVAAAV